MAIKKVKISMLTLCDTLKGLYTLGVNAANKSVKVSLEFIQTAYENAVKATTDAIDATKEANEATKDMRELEATVQENEEERENFYSSSKALVQGWSNDEQKRKEAENARVEVEKQRVEAEKERATAEATRKESENTRIASEKERIEAEKIRKSNEETRQKQETDRQTNSATAVKNAEMATERLNKLADHRDEIRDGYWWRWNEETEEWYNTGEIAKGNVMFATFEVDPTTAILTMYTDEEYTGANFTLDENGVLSVEI